MPAVDAVHARQGDRYSLEAPAFGARPAVLKRVHRWLALLLFAPVLLVGLSGAALVFREELTPLVTPEIVVAEQAGGTPRYERVLAAARAAAPGADAYDLLARQPGRAVEVWVQQDGAQRALFVDAGAGRIVADSDRDFLPLAMLYRLHKTLLLREAGETLAGLAGLALLFLSFSGFVLWQRNPAMPLRIRGRAGTLALNFDLHRSTGVVFAAILAVNAFTGVAMTFDGLSSRAVNAIAGAPAGTSPVAGAPGPMRELDLLLSAAQAAVPGGELARVTVREGKGWVIARFRLPGEQATFGMNRVHVESSTGRVLRVSLLQDLAPGNGMFEWLYPLHTGRLIGGGYRAALVAAGAAPVLLLATGLVLWHRRRRRGR